jgi:uncharacterized iron-regulated protein
MRFSVISLFIIISLNMFSQDEPAYRVFTGEGKKAGYKDILKNTLKNDVVFFGEMHDNPVAHWLELELTRGLYAEKDSNLVVAAEMFERDNQMLIDEYFEGLIKESSFESEARLWNNYKTDYKPLLDFAREKGLRFVASNIPRRYASVVSSGGFEALAKVSPEGLKYIAPLPIEYDPDLQCYKDMLSMMGGTTGHSGENLPKAQAIKDATMAYSIATNWHKGQIVIHYNGSYHSERHQGIIWYLQKYLTHINIVTICTVSQDDLSSLDEDNKDKADFIIVIPSSMTRTF